MSSPAAFLSAPPLGRSTFVRHARSARDGRPPASARRARSPRDSTHATPTKATAMQQHPPQPPQPPQPPPPAGNHDDLYGVLGLDADVGAALPARELREHYLRAARRAHPDTRMVATRDDVGTGSGRGAAAGGAASAGAAAGGASSVGVEDDATATADAPEFAAASRAWKVLGDPRRRALYHAAGMPGVLALDSVETRAEAAAEALPTGVDGETLDFLSETGQLATGLLSPAASSEYDERSHGWNPTAGHLPDSEDPAAVRGGQEQADACPRSVEQAIWNITNHPDTSVRYYGLWWIYRFKVVVATDALVHVLVHSVDQTSLGGFGLRRRAALALGTVAPMQATVLAPLADALKSTDYYLRYRAAEAIANIALREQRRRESNLATSATPAAQEAAVASLPRNPLPKNPTSPLPFEEFPGQVLDSVKDMILSGANRLKDEQASKSGYATQEGMFNFDGLEAHVASKLRAVFAERRANEERSRRTTMTPQLGVAAINPEKDEPYEWLLKALAAGLSLRVVSASSDHVESDSQTTEAVRAFLQHPLPLVRYAAHKAMYVLTADPTHAQALVGALDYGVEHHYSQRVLIRDLGDLGYVPAADAIARCGMVENSFKILALRSMLAKHNHNPSDPHVRSVLAHMDSLL